jgi:hypothetical protein
MACLLCPHLNIRFKCITSSCPHLNVRFKCITSYVCLTQVMVFDIGGALFGLSTLAGLVTPEGTVPGTLSTYLAAAAGDCLLVHCQALYLPTLPPQQVVVYLYSARHSIYLPCSRSRWLFICLPSCWFVCLSKTIWLYHRRGHHWLIAGIIRASAYRDDVACTVATSSPRFFELQDLNPPTVLLITSWLVWF